jgi:hypothetical protein
MQRSRAVLAVFDGLGLVRQIGQTSLTDELAENIAVVAACRPRLQTEIHDQNALRQPENRKLKSLR